MLGVIRQLFAFDVAGKDDEEFAHIKKGIFIMAVKWLSTPESYHACNATEKIVRSCFALTA